ncbi:unnamed protein product [Bursaphelenchus okinawaensis]|uniref:Protein kinase domain-containing protein n=1 Tax=Bursaphelenchus okinawaensis TaxID=465554 RepID=A0A811KW29_9BILA|nr:unnamed protein product [Bursaphelenchus okinawaensis]CAG9112321.1 unnamed protein product [Bursaphelenchus okinawaensis]
MGTNSRSNSKSKARMSHTRLRNGSSGGQGPSSTLGGAPLAGTDRINKDIKHRFEITKKLGEGTYGKVSLAYDHKTEKEVAVKLIKKSAIENKQDLIRIRREIRIMSMLKHPNIIQIFEVFENKDKIILVMEYASGGELYDYVGKHGSLPESEARRIFRQITSAILYCHKHKVVHRDLKLENILLDVNNNAKIADFGLSNYFSDKALLSTFCGSPLYASPEIINGTPYKGPEVDCWSLGILLYTLVYGTMPFDGQDFNRMVRQIKRGTYYEPETPSSASMLIRNMLRVNPDRRADIDEIASHWWLNLEENMPVIQELPENQITDYTPLTERAEVLYVQDLADETDVFMEFGHLSSSTRQKIEEFRRRRKEAEEYNDNSPIKPPKRKNEEKPEMTAKEKSLRQTETEEKKIDVAGHMNDPLERLRQLEKKLHTKPSSPEPSTSRTERPSKVEPQKSEEKPKDEDKKPAFVSITEAKKPATSHKPLPSNYSWMAENDSLNVLMNQVLEQMDKGPVSINLIARVKAHPMYEHRPTIKELLESIINAQPASVQKQASKVIEQACNTIKKEKKTEKTPILSPTVKKVNAIPETIPEDTKNKYTVQELPTKVDVKEAISKRGVLEDRKWHSVEVGFETDEESSGSTGSRKNSKVSTEPKITLPVRDTKSAGHVEEEEEDFDDEENECEDESEYESEIDELAEVVEQSGQSSSQVKTPKIVESLSEQVDALPQVEISANHLSTLERKLAKRQSKGKYQHSHVEMYGRGVSTEADSPPLTKKPIGGPQPSLKQSPILFDKAKQLIMEYPLKPEEEEETDKESKASKWTKTQDPDVSDKSATATPTPNRKENNVPAAPKAKQESEEESEDEGEVIRKPRTSTIIGFRTIKTTAEGPQKEVQVVEVKPQKPYQGITQKTPPAENDRRTSKEPSLKLPEERKSYEHESESPPLSPTKAGKLSYETASQYIRRKNRERRARTLTIAITDEAWQRVAEKTPEPVSKPTSPAEPLKESHIPPILRKHMARQSSKGAADSNYHRNSYLEDKRQSYAERRKSLHEFSPSESDDYATVYGNPKTPTYSSAYAPTSKCRFDLDEVLSRTHHHDPYPADPLSSTHWTSSQPYSSHRIDNSVGHEQPRQRFEVYKTRAERDRAAAANGSAYNYQDRPVSSYISGYKSQYNDYGLSASGYRRPSAYDLDPVSTSDYAPSSSNYAPDPYFTSNKDRFRPVTRRLGNNARDVDGRRARARSQSNDRKFSTSSITDIDAAAAMSARLMTPEVGTGVTDYGYVSYHDSGNSRISQTREPDISLAPTRSILKNKQAYEIEPRSTQPVQARPRSAISSEKTMGPFYYGPTHPMPYGAPMRLGSMGPSGFQLFHTTPVYGHPAEVPRGITPGSEGFDPLASSSSKKRNSGPSSFLNLRRRTAEIRLGNDGKMSTTSNGIHIDDDYKRPASPIDRLKSLFGGVTNSTSKKPSNPIYPSTNSSSRYTSALPTSTQFKRYGGGWF